MSNINDWCFACGEENPIGLKLECREQDNKYVTNFIAKKEHQSYNQTVHGGIISTLLDEITAGYINSKTGQPAFTAKIEVRFRKNTPIGVPLFIQGWIVRQKGRLYEMEANIALPDGTITAEGKVKVMTTEET